MIEPVGDRIANMQYIEFVNSHTDEIAKYVNDCFEQSKDFIRVKLLRKIREYLTPIPVHYEKKDDNHPYDCSGVIVECGNISLNQSVTSFLKNEYSGNKEATYISGMGWNYNTYEDELHYYTIEIAADIMFPAIRRYIDNQFSTTLSDEEFQDIQDACSEFDEIYDNCIANEFFFCYLAIDYVGISDMSLTTIIKKGK